MSPDIDKYPLKGETAQVEDQLGLGGGRRTLTRQPKMSFGCLVSVPQGDPCLPFFQAALGP